MAEEAELVKHNNRRPGRKFCRACRRRISNTRPLSAACTTINNNVFLDAVPFLELCHSPQRRICQGRYSHAPRSDRRFKDSTLYLSEYCAFGYIVVPSVIFWVSRHNLHNNSRISWGIFPVEKYPAYKRHIQRDC